MSDSEDSGDYRVGDAHLGMCLEDWDSHADFELAFTLKVVVVILRDNVVLSQHRYVDAVPLPSVV